MKQALTAMCSFVIAAGVWLCLMENLLRHNGYRGRSLIAAAIAIQGLSTLLFVRLGRHRFLRGLAAAGAVGAVLLGTFAILRTLHAEHFEGFVLIVGLALILEGALTLIVLFQPAPPSDLRSLPRS